MTDKENFHEEEQTQKMIKELLERQGWWLWRPPLPKSLEQDPGFEPGYDCS